MPAPYRSQERKMMYNNNILKIGLFGANCSSGRAVTTVAERWSGSAEDNIKLAKIADQEGLDFLLPVARWKGYGGSTDYQGTTLETINWATALLIATDRITVFGTVHAPLFHPIIAAKQFVTADHFGRGRFGLNLVVGWNQDEFEMFGVTQRDHEQRYVYAQEWIDAIRMIWSGAEDFTFAGKFFDLTQVRGKPKPFNNTHPLTMNAGASPTGRTFALRNCDAFFTNAARDDSPEETAKHVQSVKQEAASYGQDIDVYTVGVITCRPSASVAKEYYHHCIVDNADWGAVDTILAKRDVRPDTVGEQEFQRQREHTANGMGGLPIIGDPDQVAGMLYNLHVAGLRGIGASFVNYLAELPYFCQEVLPRLERLGVRTPRQSFLAP